MILWKVGCHPPKWPAEKVSSVALPVRHMASHHLCQDPHLSCGVFRPLLGPQGHGRVPGALWLPAVPSKRKWWHEVWTWSHVHGGVNQHCSPFHLGEVLVYNIKTPLMLTLLWTKAFTRETSSVFLPIIMITEHVIPLLFFSLFFFLASFDLSSQSVFFASLSVALLPASAISGKHTQAHMAFTVEHPSKWSKKQDQKSQV